MITLETQKKSFVICIFKILIATHRWWALPYGMKYCHWGGKLKSTRVTRLSSLVVKHKKKTMSPRKYNTTWIWLDGL